MNKKCEHITTSEAKLSEKSLLLESFVKTYSSFSPSMKIIFILSYESLISLVPLFHSWATNQSSHLNQAS